jgi:hypothetical protein
VAIQTRPVSLTEEYLIVGEGKSDVEFLRNLCDVRGIKGFQIEDARGKDNFKELPAGLKDATGFDKVRAILVVGDNDNDPSSSFETIRKYLMYAKLPCPDAPLQVARVRPSPLAVAVMMLPHSAPGQPQQGCLETVLLKYVEGAHVDLANCISEFRKCTNRPRTGNEDDKFTMRCFVAALHATDPNLSMAFVTSSSKGLIDLTDQCFDRIGLFLRDFPQLVGPQTSP